MNLTLPTPTARRVCPRCRGTIYRDGRTAETRCLSCGHELDVVILDVDTARRETEPLPDRVRARTAARVDHAQANVLTPTERALIDGTIEDDLPTDLYDWALTQGTSATSAEARDIRMRRAIHLAQVRLHYLALPDFSWTLPLYASYTFAERQLVTRGWKPVPDDEAHAIAAKRAADARARLAEIRDLLARHRARMAALRAEAVQLQADIEAAEGTMRDIDATHVTRWTCPCGFTSGGKSPGQHARLCDAYKAARAAAPGRPVSSAGGK